MYVPEYFLFYKKFKDGAGAVDKYVRRQKYKTFEIFLKPAINTERGSDHLCLLETLANPQLFL
jgi:hypothetical protein